MYVYDTTDVPSETKNKQTSKDHGNHVTGARWPKATKGTDLARNCFLMGN